MSSPHPVTERRLVFLIGAVQFVNILDFMMVMPLGPDLARALGMPSSQLGLVGGAYTAAAAVSGLLGALFLDRFDRRSALACALLGLVIATASGGLAVNLPTLLAARLAAGAFGGPATAIAFAIITDAVPVERRGRAMGAVMGAFSVASVLGIPAGLELARIGGWQLPFFAVAGLGAVIAVLVVISLPPFTAHLVAAAGAPAEQTRSSALSFFTRPTFLLSFAATTCAMMSSYSLAPNLSAYLQFNLGYPRDRLFLLYLTGGAVSFVTMRFAGALADRYGPAPIATIGGGAFVGTLYLMLLHPIAALPLVPVFAGFMICNTFRMIPMQALTSRVPAHSESARFMSTQSAVQHMSSALGATISAQLLTVDARGALVGIERVAWFAILLSLLLPVLLFMLQARLKVRQAVTPLAQPA